jgi:hypothetical protein
MRTHARVVSALLVAALLGGPLGSLAGAQQPAPPQTPQTQPPQTPPARPAPDLFQESLKAERVVARDQSSAYDAGAVVVNVFLVPGRAITCGLGAVVGVGVLALTLGTGYRAASSVWQEGCGGKWIVSGEDLRPDSVSGRPVVDYTEMR